MGDGSLLARGRSALICSQKCPGDAILKTDDFAQLLCGSSLAKIQKRSFLRS
jgi:hypothetical protein